MSRPQNPTAGGWARGLTGTPRSCCCRCADWSQDSGLNSLRHTAKYRPDVPSESLPGLPARLPACQPTPGMHSGVLPAQNNKFLPGNVH